ncbi:acyltransferase [Faecalicoccus pleomorphus]|uniref:acyltransferase n=1 Tax=Faecalicoccus pleomorphus TaxID=1323 RepID=UPI00195FA09F|nr:acyltransferase [Faecalicoccus pleomorphus]MBM6765076.1 acyltransferase [Faecalicoccus pleomorphus]
MLYKIYKRFKDRIKNDPRGNNEKFIEYLRNKGVHIGKNCTFYDPHAVDIDTTTPHMLYIGDYVRITSGVQILTHDYSLSVVCSVVGDVVGSIRKTVIGNNVFIGRNAIILRGVTVGDNVIIGAGSVVSHDCDSNSVYAGVPAKRICSLEEVYEKWKKSEKDDALNLARTYYRYTGKNPNAEVLREFQMLFTDCKKYPTPPDSLKDLMEDSGCYEKCYNYYKNHAPEFEGIEAFLKWCGIPK